MTREEILSQVQDLMVELFELDRDTVTPAAHLVDDLDLDSIDAIDMVVKLQEMTGKRVEEGALREIRTIADIIDLVQAQSAATSTEASTAEASTAAASTPDQ